MIAADVRDREFFRQVTVKVFQQSSHFFVGPSLAHGAFPGKVYRGTPVSAGSVFGAQVTLCGFAALSCGSRSSMDWTSGHHHRLV